MTLIRLALYVPILVVRASLPLLARVGQALQVEPLGRMRLLSQDLYVCALLL